MNSVDGSARRGRRALLLGLLMVVVAAQGYAALERRLTVPAMRLDTVHSDVEAAVRRSASLAFGSDFAEYIQFLRAEIPQERTAALPPPTEHVALSHTGLMQYFLFPRRTTNCPADQAAEQCLAQIGGSGVYVLKVGDFPDAELEAELEKNYLPFNEEWGLYLPAAPDEGG